MESLDGGLNGCPPDWVMVTIPVNGDGLSEVEVFPGLADVRVDSRSPPRTSFSLVGRCVADCPLGLPAARLLAARALCARHGGKASMGECC